MFTKGYGRAVKAAEKDFCATSIASASSHPAQLFKIIPSLTSLS